MASALLCKDLLVQCWEERVNNSNAVTYLLLQLHKKVMLLGDPLFVQMYMQQIIRIMFLFISQHSNKRQALFRASQGDVTGSLFVSVCDFSDSACICSAKEFLWITLCVCVCVLS